MFDMPPDTSAYWSPRRCIARLRARFTTPIRGHPPSGNLDDHASMKRLKVVSTRPRRSAKRFSTMTCANPLYSLLSHDADWWARGSAAYRCREGAGRQADIAAVWGRAPATTGDEARPITLQRSTHGRRVPLEFDMAVAVRTSDKDMAGADGRALHASVSPSIRS